MKGRIFDVQRFSVHDGPGIRTTVFLKGCPLRCRWCHNPEGLSARIELQFMEEACIGCGACGARTSLEDASACPAEALRVCGYDADEDTILEAILRDRIFYGSTGGITFSGGECLLQADFVSAVLGKAKAEGLHTAVDTCGEVPWSELQKTLPVCDLYLYDVKCVSPALHKVYTGVDNIRIRDNLRRLSDTGKPIWIRIPVIPTFNATRDEMEAIARFLAPLSVEKVTLMPYHSLGAAKYPTLGLTYPFDPTLKVSAEEMARYGDIFAAHHMEIT